VVYWRFGAGGVEVGLVEAVEAVAEAMLGEIQAVD